MAENMLSEDAMEGLQEDWNKIVAADAKYWLENDAKLRAITSAKSYEEFSDVVKTAHLKPLTQKEMLEMKEKKSGWDFLKLENFNNQSNCSSSQFQEDEVYQIQTSSDFVSFWNKLDDNGRMIMLQNTPIENLQSILQKDVPPGMLGDLTRIIKYSPENKDWLLQLLKALSSSERFQLNLLFLKSDELGFYSKVLDEMEPDTEALSVKKSFGLLKQ